MLIGVEEDDARLYMPSTGGRNLMLGERVELQCSHNDFEVRPSQSPAFLVTVTGVEGTLLYICPGLHLFEPCCKEAFLGLARILNIKRESIPPNYL